jgi:hypothetical protein
MQERFDFDRCKNATLTAATTDALLRAAMLKASRSQAQMTKHA